VRSCGERADWYLRPRHSAQPGGHVWLAWHEWVAGGVPSLAEYGSVWLLADDEVQVQAAFAAILSDIFDMKTAQCHTYVRYIGHFIEAMNRVRQFRKQKQLSQQALADLVEVSRQTVNMIENQYYNPTLSLCIRLAKVLDTDLNALFWEEENEQIQP